jgi:nucleoside-diphosphate-sugar epimerase
MNGKVLITGGAGFIGFHLARSLVAAGYQVDLLDNLGRGVRDAELEALLDGGNTRLLKADLCDGTAVAALDDDYRHIYHLAAIIGVVHVLGRPYDVLRDNTLMLANVIDLGRRQKALERLLFASTSEVYAGSLASLDLPVPTPETAVIALPDLSQARTSYMLSKLYGEAMCLQSGLPVSIIRPHNVYGPRMGMVHVVPELLHKAYRAADGGELPVASVHHSRAFCYVDDAVTMIRALVEAPAGVGQVVNLGKQDEEVTIGALAEVLIATVGRALRVAATEVTPGSPSRRCPDMARMESLTGVVAQVGLKEGVARTFAWYRANVFDAAGACAR